MTKILIIDDERQIRRFLSISLGSQGYDIVEATSGLAGLEAAALSPPDVIILDLGLPDLDGLVVLERLRDFFVGPIIVLSIRSSERDKVAALDLGCNDYISKPFGVNELLARIRAHIRTFSAIENSPAGYEDADLKIDFLHRSVFFKGQELHLSKKEFTLLSELIAHPNRVLTQRYLLEKIWGRTHLDDTHYLRVFIGKLRSKLGDDPTSPRYIQTEAGVGYRFLGKDDS